jgi:hypothetical protein
MPHLRKHRSRTINRSRNKTIRRFCARPNCPHRRCKKTTKTHAKSRTTARRKRNGKLKKRSTRKHSQRGGVQGLINLSRVGITGITNTFNQLTGVDTTPSPLPWKDQY